MYFITISCFKIVKFIFIDLCSYSLFHFHNLLTHSLDNRYLYCFDFSPTAINVAIIVTSVCLCFFHL